MKTFNSVLVAIIHAETCMIYETYIQSITSATKPKGIAATIKQPHYLRSQI